MRRILLSMALLGGTAALWAQAPVEPLAIVQPPKLPDAKKDEKKDDKKSEEKKAPPPPVTDRSLTFPAANLPPAAPIAAGSTAIAISALPPVYGDFLSGSFYYPYLQAYQPNGQQISIAPGVNAILPLGTTFNQPVQTQIVRVQVGTREEIDPINEKPIVVPVFENRLQVTGPPAQASVGGLPINVVRGAFKIGENESPRPTDRLYATYNYFYDVNASLGVPGLPITNVHRQTLGVEKTFLDGDASIGLRLPLLQISGAQNIESQSVGDLSVVLKYAFINQMIQNPDGTLSPGNLLSAGLVVTAPTGNTAAYTNTNPVVHSTVLQPWVGAIYVNGNVYAQGFSSVAVPTDSTDTTFLFNSLQIGYLAWRSVDPSRLLQSVTPIVEVHVNTPLNNRGIDRLPVGSFDIVDFTAGTTLGLGARSYLNVGVNVPVTGPRPYGIEAILQLNFYY